MGTAGTPPLADGSAARGGPPLESESGASPRGLAPSLEHFQCLRCRSGGLVSVDADTLGCNECGARYPVSRCGDICIPWLFVDPGANRLQWKARYHGFLQQNSMDLERLRDLRAASAERPKTRKRVSALLQAREGYRRQIVDLLAPFDLEQIDWPADTTAVLEGRLPNTLNLSSHVDTLFRDWAWDSGESETLLDAVARLLDTDPRIELGTVLVLGAGAGRLSYDVYKRYRPRRSITLDVNPLLLLTGARIARGEAVSLFEFPEAPADDQSFAIEQRCCAPTALPGGALEVVLADPLDLPFAAQSIDTIVTSWMVDTLFHDPRVFLPKLNRCLADGGLWVNSGPLAFPHQNESLCYGEEEFLDLIEQSGFDILATERRTVTHLQSPHSATGRTAQIISLSAMKRCTVDLPEHSQFLPDWLRDTRLPVPASSALEHRASSHLLTAHILRTIDGKKSIGQIGRRVARQYGLGLPETVQAVRQVLLDTWEETEMSGTERES